MHSYVNIHVFVLFVYVNMFHGSHRQTSIWQAITYYCDPFPGSTILFNPRLFANIPKTVARASIEHGLTMIGWPKQNVVDWEFAFSVESADSYLTVYSVSSEGIMTTLIKLTKSEIMSS